MKNMDGNELKKFCMHVTTLLYPGIPRQGIEDKIGRKSRYPMIQAPPVTNITTGFDWSIFSDRYRSNLLTPKVCEVLQPHVRCEEITTTKVYRVFKVFNVISQIAEFYFVLTETTNALRTFTCKV